MLDSPGPERVDSGAMTLPAVFWLAALQVTAAQQQAVVTTSAGTFVLSFYPEKAPGHVELFLRLAAEGAYDGTRFHRVVRWGIVQGGDPLSKDPGKKALWGTGGMNRVKSEVSDCKHVRGTASSVEGAGKPDSGGDGMTTDAQGRYYVTSHVGIQMFDWTGRLGGVIARPQNKGTVSVTFAGANLDYLYACSSDKIYRRKTTATGVLFFQPPALTLQGK